MTSWRLKAGDEVVAELGPELPQADPNVRSWPLYPTSAFERVRPIIVERQAMRHERGALFPPSVMEIEDAEERERAMQAFLRTDPASLKRTAAMDRFSALNLTIVDETGTPLEAWSVGASEFPGLPSVPFEEWMRPNFERAGFRGNPPFYMATAVLKLPSSLGPDYLREDKMGPA